MIGLRAGERQPGPLGGRLHPGRHVLVEGDTIREVSPRPLKAGGARVIDAGGRTLMPGLIDCHTHLVYGGNRAQEFERRLAGVSYEEIARQGGGIVSTVRATRTASAIERNRRG